MKKCWCTLSTLWLSYALYGQVLAEWSFENVSSAIASVPISASYVAPTCSNADAYLYGGNNVGTPNVCSGQNAWATNFWPTSDTYSDGDCMEFTLTAKTLDLLITGFSFSASLSSDNGPQQYAVSFYTSAGEFGLLGYGGFGAGGCAFGGAGPSFILPKGANLAIRIHPYRQNPAALAATLRIDDVQIYGAQFLPVELLAFTLEEETDHSVLLSWQTASENNLDYLVIERSTDARHFQEIKRLQAEGNRVELRNYQFKDLVPQEGCNYYRLKFVDLDSSVAYSEIRVLCLAQSRAFYVKAYPNPSSNMVHLILPLDLDQIRLSLLDLRGKTWPVVRSGNLIDLSGLARGSYLLQWESKTHNGAIVIQKI